ncbi:hypothetical protein J7413_04680 [Shimia sp. R10_1]|nr:hypothetical protein [Shimia sp. R10_1]MBO9472826.1 hypothetical protein [Shimia sp. R10_1]
MRYFILFMTLVLPTSVFADPPEITNVTAASGANGWRFDVTIAHPDTGWDHYADGWRIETEDGQVLGTRILAHPHVNEQPFTRSLANVWIPPEITTIYLRSKDNIDGWSKTAVAFELP